MGVGTMTDEVHIEDVGTIIRVYIKEKGSPLDLTNASVIKMKFERKDRSKFQVDGTPYGSPIDGAVQCLSDKDFFTGKGKMTVQIYLEYPSGKWHTSEAEFEVFENIEVTSP